MDAKHPVRTTEKTLAFIEELKERGLCGVTGLASGVEMGEKRGTQPSGDATGTGMCPQQDDEKYRFGLKFLDIGGYARKSMGFYQVAEPEVQSLPAETGELANLLVEEQGVGVYLMRSKGEKAVDLDTYACLRTNLHTTALGKAILAYLPESRIDEIIKLQRLEKETPQSIGTREELFEALDAIRDCGYAIDDGERLEGLRCIAAPIKHSSGAVLGEISVSAPASRFSDENIHGDPAERVLNAANVIELSINY